jgi:hypothetical protein
MTISDEELLQLWKDPKFSGSFRGVKTFQTLLKTDRNIDVSENRLYQVLKKEPLYLVHLQPQRKFERRHYDVRYYGELVQADIAYMVTFNEYKYFLLLTDCFSSKIFGATAICRLTFLQPTFCRLLEIRLFID